MSPQPWTPEHRARLKAKIDELATDACEELRANSVRIVAVFDEGEFSHLLDGGNAPPQVMKLCWDAHVTLQERGEGYVKQ